MNSAAGGSAADVPPDFAALYVERVRVRHFRGIDDCTVELEPDLTVFVGRNNAGKSRLLRALALGLGTESAERDDLTVGGQAEASIDIVLAPRPVDGAGDVFTDRIAQRLDSQLVQNLAEDPPQERFAWRTVIRPSNEGFGVRAESGILTYDVTNQEWTAGQQALPLSARQRSLVVGDLVQTRRDLADELLRRGSPIRRVLDDLEVAEDRRVEIEQRLAGLGSDIVAASGSLAAVRTALEVLARSIDEIGSPRLEPLPIRLEELARAVSINLAVGGTDLPLRFTAPARAVSRRCRCSRCCTTAAWARTGLRCGRIPSVSSRNPRLTCIRRRSSSWSRYLPASTGRSSPRPTRRISSLSCSRVPCVSCSGATAGFAWSTSGRWLRTAAHCPAPAGRRSMRRRWRSCDAWSSGRSVS